MESFARGWSWRVDLPGIPMVASIINTYTSTAYHACLYFWARNVEVARAAGQPSQVATPRRWQLC